MALSDRSLISRRLAGAMPAPVETPQPKPEVRTSPVSVVTPLPKPAESAPPMERTRSTLSPESIEIKHRVHDRLVRELDAARLSGAGLSPEAARRAVEDAVSALIVAEGLRITRAEELVIMREIADEIVGYGPIEPLLQDETISEVMINAYDQVFFERRGVLYRSDRNFRDDAHVLQLIDKIVTPLGRRIDESSPMVDARLPDGSRVNAIIPPLALHGPSVTIRKFAKKPLTAEDLVRYGSLSAGMVELLRACVASRLNILVSGGTGSGKTTLLNVLSNFISNSERIVSIEDPAELQLQQDNWVSLETRPPNVEGKGQVVQRDLLRNALRMRPDRIIVGECRAGEAFDMLQAMNTGHDGSLTTVHANTPRDALARIENMVLMANLDLPTKAIREQIGSAINVVVQLSRLSDGSRRVTHVSELVGMEGEVITMHDIFLLHQRGVEADGKVISEIRPTGIRPVFSEKLEQHGFHLPAGIFRADGGAL